MVYKHSQAPQAHTQAHPSAAQQDEDSLSAETIPVTGISVAGIVESIIGCKWSVRLLKALANEIYRPSALLRACPGLSAKVMNERLRKMSDFGIIKRTVYGDKPPVEVSYLLTPFGNRFMTILDAVQQLQAAVDSGAISAHEEIDEEVTR